MVYTKLEIKLIAIRKMLPKAEVTSFTEMLKANQKKAKKKLETSKSYFFK